MKRFTKHVPRARDSCTSYATENTDYLTSSVSIKKDYSGSSTVQASDRDVLSVVEGSVDRSVGRHTRSVDGYTRRLVSRRDRTVRKRLPLGTCFSIA